MNKRGDYNSNTINTESASRSHPPWVLIAAIIFFVIVILIGILIAINFVSFEDGKLTLGKSKGLTLKAAYIDGENVNVLVGRGSAKGNLTGIRFIFYYNDTDNVTVERAVVLGENEEKTFVFNPTEIPGVINYQGVSIAPIYSSVSGEITVGKIDDTKKISATPPSSGGGGGGSSGGGGSGGTSGNTGNITGTPSIGSASLGSDSDNDLVASVQSAQNYATLIYDWKLNGASIAVLNMPFDTQISSTNSGAIKDYSDYENAGTLGGGNSASSPTWTNGGASGGAYTFDGSNDYITVNDSSSLDIGTKDFSISAWIKTSENSTYPQLVFGKKDLNNLNINTDRLNDWAPWGSDMIVTYDSDIAPNGVSEATLLTQNGAVWDRWVGPINSNIESGLTFTFSLWTKAPSTNPVNDYELVIEIINATGTPRTLKKTTFTATPNWERHEVTATLNQSISTIAPQIRIGADENGGSLLVWGAQLEESWTASPYVSDTSDNSDSKGYGLWVGEGKIKASMGGTDKSVTTQATIPLGQFVQVVAVYDRSSNLDLYVNGILKNSMDISGLSGVDIGNLKNLRIGGLDNSGLNSFNGVIDEIVIYDRALTEVQVDSLYNAGSPRYEQILSHETNAGGAWAVEVTPNSGTSDGVSVTSNALTATTPPSTWIYPGQDIQAAVNSHPTGTEFLIKAGTHRLQGVSPKSNDIFTGESGAIMSGAKLLTGFEREGDYWVATGQTQEATPLSGSSAECNTFLLNADGSQYTGCLFPNDLFFDDIAMFQVVTKEEVDPGEWYFDYAADKIYFLDDPRGHKVEASVTDYAFKNTSEGVTVRNLTVEKYAQPAQRGAIGERSGTNWIIENNEARLNHGAGIRISTGTIVRNNYIHHNGQIGILGSGQNVLIDSNEIAYNDVLDYSHGWEAGATKFVYTDGLIVRNNYVHDNYGNGLWTDINNINSLYEYNTITDNYKMGIHHEISYDAIIRNNYVANNGWEYGFWHIGSGILISVSPNVEVYNNTLVNNYNGIVAWETDRGTGLYGLYITENFSAHDNIVQVAPGSKNGFIGKDRILTQNNSFDYNTYDLTQAYADPFWYASSNQNLTESEWMAFGQDVHGVFNR